MKAYELLYIIRPELDDEAAAALVDKFSEVVTNNGGADVAIDKWGKRRLAYEIDDLREGNYVLMNFNGEARTAQEVERVMKISDSVVRFLTTKKKSSIGGVSDVKSSRFNWPFDERPRVALYPERGCGINLYSSR